MAMTKKSLEELIRSVLQAQMCVYSTIASEQIMNLLEPYLKPEIK